MASSKEAVAQNGEQGSSKVKLEGEALKDAIKKQVEYYFSRENLCQDSFLVSKMDAQHYVDVAIIADFKMVKLLTSDTELILSCVANSDKVIVDASRKKMKPVAVNARTTLILRNIPTDAPEGDVRALISGDKWPKIVSLRSDVGDNWFVSFETEDETKTALEMAKGMKYKDKSISCAIKSENLLKGLQPGSPPKTGPSNGVYPGMYGGYMANGGYGWNGAYAAGEGGFNRGARAGGGSRGGRAGPGAGGPAANGVAADDGNSRNGNGSKRNNKPKAREGRDAQGSSPNAEKKVEQAPINLNEFPSLAGSAPATFSKPKLMEGKEMISIFKEAKGGEGEGGKRDTREDASQNKAHDAAASSSESSGATVDNDKAGAAGKSVEAASAESSAGGGGGDAGKAGGDAPASNGSSSGAPKKMSYAQMANASKAAPAAVST